MCILKYDSGENDLENWVIEETGFDPLHLRKCESIFTQGNGYMGVRAAQEEAYIGEERGMFVNGTFNRFDKNEVTELPNLPDITGLNLYVNGMRFHLESGQCRNYSRSFCLKTGELTRSVEWESPQGDVMKLRFKRIVSQTRKHIIAQRIEITPMNAGMELKVESGIDARVTNSGSQHFSEGDKRFIDGKYMQMALQTTQSHIDILVHTAHHFFIDGASADLDLSPVIERRIIFGTLSTIISQGGTLTIEKISTVHTSRDLPDNGADPASVSKTEKRKETTLAEQKETALAEMKHVLARGYTILYEERAREWNDFWSQHDISLLCDDGIDQLSLRFAIYHLNIMTGHGDNRMGIGAKALSGEGYKGHSFWDTENFILPCFLLTNPENARKLLEYRYLCADGSRKKAIENGYDGLMYPWESAWIDEGEVTPLWGEVDIVTGTATPILTGQIEQHVTADIAFAVNEYDLATGDIDFMEKYGYEIIIGTAQFWASRAEWNQETAYYEIRNVIGPDEYKEHVDNNAYTNYMAYTNMNMAIEIIEKLKTANTDVYERLSTIFSFPALLKILKKVSEKFYLPQPLEGTGIIPQDDTYLSKREINLDKYKNAEIVGTIFKDYNLEQINSIQVSKQSDVVLLIYLFEKEFSRKTRLCNYEYYEKHTLHDSSLSNAMHSVVASRLGRIQEAYCFFQKA